MESKAGNKLWISLEQHLLWSFTFESVAMARIGLGNTSMQFRIIRSTRCKLVQHPKRISVCMAVIFFSAITNRSLVRKAQCSTK